MMNVIQERAHQLGLPIPADLGARIEIYLDLLERWNRRIRLVAPASREVWIERHVVDSLHAAAAVPGEAQSLLDVGAGGGFPGLVIALLRPALAVTALEPVRKKHAFLAAAARATGATRFVPRAERLDAHLAATPPPYDAAISRATWSVGEWLARAAPAIAPGGLVLAMEGRLEEPLPPGAVREPYELGDRRRAIITYRPPMDPGPQSI
ncbi:MAG TPA: RsmG family class I SAM-dependent methyltransferase [Kofleriaceae bacterium]|nr:RsmG family class I SAM-dependent methyltransferase [Kofleriaceae bacterium]